MPLDRYVIDLAWKASHGALLTMDRLLSFGYNHLSACFCGFHLESAEHLFFHCALAKSGIDWLQSLLFRAAPLSPTILLRHVLFGFSPDELLVVPVSLFTFSTPLSSLYGVKGMTSALGASSLEQCPSSLA